MKTDIAAAASLAGLSILRSKGLDLCAFTPGTMLLTELDTEIDEIWQFMKAAAENMGLNPSEGWDQEIPAANKPLYTVSEMTQKIKKTFLAICSRHRLKMEFFTSVAVLAALKLVYAADTLKVLDQDIGKALTGHHIMAGAKTVPSP